MEVLDNIPVSLDLEKVIEVIELIGALRVSKRSKHLKRSVEELIEIARPIAKPKVVYEVCYVTNKNGNWVEIDCVRFTSRVLRINLDKVERVFPWVATCGRELEEIAVPADDLVKYHCLGAIKAVAMISAYTYLEDYLARKYALGQMSTMSPGPLEDWPLTQQKELLSLFGNVEHLIGVKLTESFLIIPLNSASGMYFPTEIKFETCQLCPWEGCRARMAPYSPDLAKRYQ